MSLVSLTLMDSEGIHYHYDPETQFYNQCHDEDGKFCEGLDGPGRARDNDKPVRGEAELRDSDGKTPSVKVPTKRGPRGESLVDPNEGTNEFDGLKGYDKVTGKPVPGSDAWLEAHGISREIFKSRPYVKFEASKTDPALHEAFEAGSPGRDQWNRLAEQPGQTGGFIMYKHAIPDSPYGPITPQIRPNAEAVTNHGKRAQTLKRLEQAKQRYEDLQKIQPSQLIKEQEARVKKAQLNLDRTKKATPEIIRAEAKKGLEDATAAYEKAKASKDPEKIVVARKDKAAALREIEKAEYKASKFKAESAVYHANKELESAKQRLSEMKEDPKGFLAAEIIRQGGTDGKGGAIKRAQNAYKKSASKYLFTRGADTSRIDINPDKQNVKNLMEGKGRIYFAMEGSIKNDAVLAAIKREDPTAAVVNVPSVTLWHNKSAGEGEIKWFARTHAKDRQIVLIPDADGVNNVNVVRQANALAAALKTGGAKEVLVAAPPVKHGTKAVIDPVKLPSKDAKGNAVFDERKGIDDHLGAGRGTLGQLAYTTDEKVPASRFSLKHLTREGGNTGDAKLNRNALKNHENMLAAISSLAGKNGAVQASKNLLMQTSGITSPGSAIAARDKLHELGIIDVRYVFDKDVLAQSRKRVPVMSQKEIDQWVSKKIIKPLPDDLFAKDDYEASPIIVIKDPKYIVKETGTRTGVISDLPDWKPPKTYDGWRSPLTGKKDTTGIADKQAENEAKTKAKNKGASVSVAQTAEQRAAKKVAPTGRRLVRTKAGAERYGVAIGQPIPLAGETSIVDPGIITSMVLLSSVMTEDELTEFYNRCHGKDGLFCEGEDGAGRVRDKAKGKTLIDTNEGQFETGRWPAREGRPFEKVGEWRTGGRWVIDVGDVKQEFNVTAEDGSKIKLYDTIGEITDDQANSLLQNHARMQEMYHLVPVRHVLVTRPPDIQSNAAAAVYMSNDERYTMVNWDVYKNKSLGDDRIGAWTGEFMPAAKKGSYYEYTMTHEFGHQVDGYKNYDERTHQYYRSPLTLDSRWTSRMSRYAKSDPDGYEHYAEAFAEWHHTDGQTKHPSAIALARAEGWNGNDYRPFDPAGRAPLHRATAPGVNEYYGPGFGLLSMVELADEPVKPTDKGLRVLDTFTKDGAFTEGSYTVVEPSQAEKDEATKILDEVLKETKGSEETLSTETVEFYNQCHDEDGLFCEGEDGAGRVRDKEPVKGYSTVPLKTGGVKKVASAILGSVEVDGIKAKSVYELKDRKGNVHKLYDKSGDVTKDDADLLLWSHARMAEIYPLNPPRDIVVTRPQNLLRDRNSKVDSDSFAIVYGDDHRTYVNSERLGTDLADFRDGFQMPSAKDTRYGRTDNMDYLMKHEYGHHVDFARNSDSGYEYKIHPLWKDQTFRDSVSRYGSSDDKGIESYAETFADWHHSGGTSTNPATRSMAYYEGWIGTPGYKKSIAASGNIYSDSRSIEIEGELVSLTLLNSVHFANDNVKYFPEDTEDDINADIPKLGKSVRVSDTFTEDGAIIEGDFKVIEPSAEEITKAKKIMDDVLKELGLEK